MVLSDEPLTDVKRFAAEIRLNTLETLNHLGFGHYGGSLSIVELLAVLYGEIMPMTPELFAQSDRDYLVLSKGMLVQPSIALSISRDSLIRLFYSLLTPMEQVCPRTQTDG